MGGITNGGIPTSLTLSGGVYHITELELGTDAQAECTALCFGASRRPSRCVRTVA